MLYLHQTSPKQARNIFFSRNKKHFSYWVLHLENRVLEELHPPVFRIIYTSKLRTWVSPPPCPPRIRIYEKGVFFSLIKISDKCPPPSFFQTPIRSLHIALWDMYFNQIAFYVLRYCNCYIYIYIYVEIGWTH